MKRIGCVKYLNTLPLIEGLAANRDVELVSAVPSKLGDMLASGEVDVALVSMVDATRSAVPLAIVPSGGIGCDGPTLTVRVFSQVPPEKITTLHVDTDSHTSVILAQVILAKRFGTRVKVVDFDARERVAVGAAGGAPSNPGEWPEAVLMIGDKVVTDSPPAVRYPHQLDLGEEWKRLTGLPFVYAAWMCRAAESAEAWVGPMADLLERQRLRNTMRTEWLISRAVDERRWPRDLAIRYVTEYLRYEVGPQQREGIERFFAEASGLGLLPATRPAWVGQTSPAI